MRHSVLLLGLAALGIVSLAGCSSDRTPGATATQFGNTIQCKKPEGNRAPLELKAGEVRRSYDLCFQPEKAAYEGRPIKIIWGQTAPLGPVIADLSKDASGKPTLQVTGGRNTFQMTTQAPGTERIAFNFSTSGLDATSGAARDVVDTSTDFKGDLVVPPLRGLGYTDARGRGTDAGYESSQGSYATGGEQFEKGTEESRARKVGKGEMTLSIESINSETGEIAGTFKSTQDSGLAIVPGELEVEGRFIGTFKPKKTS
ncbi:photosystem II manganese-stabilizing protein [Gloeobacter kilaueensis]|uniref:Photosystem II extrinsic protein O n=1 Tax=Gloeobacter kilaueensis (strain ATCC BAA-2537 / CCAP 1431/1 / ULC 316 / JS1) TaxID=1183438 RepID=U5QFK1_GLOK1|nr:photosystem II manganese-stabilizing protein [Gloeobacter kilaueensis]AGY56450.1 photosystem II manganese-stabilizing protein [Gloeobacter kilaueensis JS1]